MTQSVWPIALSLLALFFFVSFQTQINAFKISAKMVPISGQRTLHFSIVQAQSIFILLRLRCQSGWSDFTEIYCTIWPLLTIFFVTDFLLCAQKTEVVEMDEISKFKFDLGHAIMPCNMKTWIFHLTSPHILILTNTGNQENVVSISGLPSGNIRLYW